MKEIRDGEFSRKLPFWQVINHVFLFILGIKLRKVEQLRDDIRHQKQSNLHDVASILARRVAIELSDSESDSDDSDEEWMEPNETSAWYNEKSEKEKSKGEGKKK